MKIQRTAPGASRGLTPGMCPGRFSSGLSGGHDGRHAPLRPHHTRNIPLTDDFAPVPMMTGHEPVSLRWAWSQHNEHRPVLSRLILAGLSRYVKNDFRAGRYFNAG